MRLLSYRLGECGAGCSVNQPTGMGRGVFSPRLGGRLERGLDLRIFLACQRQIWRIRSNAVLGGW